MSCITEEGSPLKKSSLTSTLGDFEVVSNYTDGIYSFTKIQKFKNKQPLEKNLDIYPLYRETNNSIYIVKVTSPGEFYLGNFYYTHSWNVITDKQISTTRYRYCFLTDKIELETLKGIGIEGEFEFGSLQYFHIQLGKLKLTKDNRKLTNMNGSSWTDRMTYKNPILIPSGTWYFVFVGTIFDLDEDEMLSNISLWMNFSGTNLDISTSDEGVVYGLWFGELDANLIISRAHKSETMIGGKTQFTIDNIFIYKLTLFRPKNQGFWRMKWITPSEIKRMSIIIIDGIRYGNQVNYEKCMIGIGESGAYKLSTSYYDYMGNDIIYASSIYLVGLDVKLF